jgi:hypothetical protein
MRRRGLFEYRVFEGDRRARIFLTIPILLVGFFIVGLIGV